MSGDDVLIYADEQDYATSLDDSIVKCEMRELLISVGGDKDPSASSTDSSAELDDSPFPEAFTINISDEEERSEDEIDEGVIGTCTIDGDRIRSDSGGSVKSKPVVKRNEMIKGE